MNTDRIERSVRINAPRSRVWRALTTPEEFGNWFGAKLPGQTFAPGQRARGRVTCPGYEHLEFDITIERMEPQRLFSWRWQPGVPAPGVDYTREPTTLVVFELADAEGGTLLKVTESGFDQIPAARRLDVFRMNSDGWDGQMNNITNHATTP